MGTQVSKWQSLLDNDFPQGMICVYAGREDSPVYRVPRVTVTGTAGFDPEVWLPVWSEADKVLGPLRVLSYHVEQRNPCTVARVTVDGAADPAMLWSSGVSPLLAHALAPDRQYAIRLSPHGGDAVMLGTRKAG